MKSIRISKRAPLLAAAFAGFALAPSELAAQGTVVGGSKNAAPGGISVVVGGAKNRSVGGGSVIVGGNTNRANGDNSAIVTGFQNTTGTTGKFSGIGAGSNNLITGQGSFIGSGNKNTASGLSTIVLGGTDNTCSGQFSVIGGGRRNTLAAKESFLFGNDINHNGTNTGIVYLADNSRGGSPLAENLAGNTMACRFDKGLLFFADPTSISPDLQITQAGTCFVGSGVRDAGLTIHTVAAPTRDPFRIEYGGTRKFIVDPDGRVGIGVTTVTKAALEISGSATASTGGASTFHSGTSGSSLIVSPATFDIVTSIHASNSILGLVLLAFSDERIKQIEGVSDPSRDLSTLMGIEVTDYTHIDTIAKGSGKQKKVIAQQVEQVYPQAVSRSTDVVPDIYKLAGVSGGWVHLESDLKIGDRVRLIGEKKEGIHEVLEVAQGKFRTSFEADAKNVFVYGREVDDFRNVDYDAIAMLNVSATQELARRLVAKDAEFTKLKAENEALAQKLAENDAKLAALDARDTAREERLARLEQSLEDAARTVSVPVALKVAK